MTAESCRHCSYKLCTGSAKEHLRLQINFAWLFSRRRNVILLNGVLTAHVRCDVAAGDTQFIIGAGINLLQYFKMVT